MIENEWINNSVIIEDQTLTLYLQNQILDTKEDMRLTRE